MDRKKTYKKKGGGVLISISRDFVATRIDALDAIGNKFNCIDIIGLKLTLYNKVINLIAVYIPPSIKASILVKIIDLFSEILTTLGNNILVVGDFNCPGLNKCSIKHFPDNYTKILNEFFYTNKLKQFNNLLNFNGVFLDLCISSFKVYIDPATEIITRIDSHHPPIVINVLINMLIGNTREFNRRKLKNNYNLNSTIPNKINKYNFKQLNKEQLLYSPSFADWSLMHLMGSTEDTCKVLYDLINEKLGLCLSLHTGGPLLNKYPVWFSKSLIKSIEYKNRIWNKFKKQKCNALLDKFKSIRKLVKSTLNSNYNKYLSQIEYNMIRNPADFWNYIRSLKTNNQTINCLIVDGLTLDGPSSIAKAFKKVFSEIYSYSSSSMVDVQLSPDTYHETANIPLLDYLILALKSLPRKKTKGLDGLPCSVIKVGAQYLKYPLLILIKKIYESGSFPSLLNMRR